MMIYMCRIQNGFEVKVSDLYEMNFNPVTSKDDFMEIANMNFISLVMEQKNAV